MIIVTSIFPNHVNNSQQRLAVGSWAKYGKVYSLNCRSEHEKSEEYDDVEFIVTEKTLEYFTGKPLVSINALIDLSIEKDDDLLIINSDIIISTLPEFKNDGVTIFSRFDYTNSYADANVYEHGFDAFFIPKDLLKIYTPTIYGMGNVWWDYSIPYRAIVNNIPVYWADGRFIYHKMHLFQWDFTEWDMLGRFFQIEFKIDKTLDLGQMSIIILRDIKSRAIKIY